MNRYQLTVLNQKGETVYTALFGLVRVERNRKL